MLGIHRGFALRKLKVPARTGMGRDFVVGYPESLLPTGTRYHGILGISTVIIYINGMKITSSDSLSVWQYVHIERTKRKGRHLKKKICLTRIGHILFPMSPQWLRKSHIIELGCRGRPPEAMNFNEKKDQWNTSDPPNT